MRPRPWALALLAAALAACTPAPEDEAALGPAPMMEEPLDAAPMAPGPDDPPQDDGVEEDVSAELEALDAENTAPAPVSSE